MKGDDLERRSERRARGAAARRRAQMYLGQLRWLEGFEADGRWHLVGDEPGDISLEGLALARAQRTVNILRRNHRGVLSHVMDDPAAWFAAADGVLRRLGERAHGRQATVELASLLPARVRAAVLALELDYPALGPLIRAACSVWATRAGALAAAIRWMRPRAALLHRMIEGAGPQGLRRALSLALLAADDTSGVDALIALALTDVADVAQTTERLTNLIRRLSDVDKHPASLPARSPETIALWIDRLLVREPGARTRALALLGAVNLPAVLHPFSVWEAEHGPRVARAAALAARGAVVEGGAKPEDIANVIAGVDRARQALPPAIDLGRVLAAIDLLAEPRHEPFQRGITRLVAALPPECEPIAAVRFVSHAAQAAAWQDGPQAAWLWEAVATELAAGAPDRILGPWKRVTEGKAQSWIEDGLLRHARRHVEVKRFGAALARLARDLPASEEQAQLLADVLAGGLDVDTAVALTRGLDQAALRPSATVVRAAVALAGSDLGGLVGLIRAVQNAGVELLYETELALLALCEHAAATDGTWLITGLITRHGRRALELAELTRGVPRGQWPPLCTPAERPRWIADYPPSLATALARLATTDPEAERTARRRTAADLPERDALKREAAALRARRPLGPRQARRLANLEARIATPRPPTPARLARLAAKLEVAAIERGAERFAATLTRAASERLASRLGIQAPPDWTSDRMLWSILLALVELDPADRALAGRLLRARAGPLPWDLRDDPANQAFLARLSARGVDAGAWLDDARRVVAGADGKPVELALCDDPLEVFAMGAHFETCLAPGGSNFFSVIANAADINKRVLYARRDGRVAARCLLALTDAGQVLTFHPYAHDDRLGFPFLVRDFAAELAARMRSQVARTGRVATLLARDWYDDGVRDLVGRYGPHEAPAFARALQEVPLSGAVALIEQTLGRPLDDVTLPVVVAAAALEQRPQLVAALAPRLLALATVPDETLLKAAHLATKAGDTALADRLMLGPASRADLHDGTWHWGQVLARLRPSFALARLRQTRRRGVRGWNGEWGVRLAVAGLAMEHLHRPRQAAAMYRRAIADEPWLANEIGDRLAALDRAAGR